MGLKGWACGDVKWTALAKDGVELRILRSQERCSGVRNNREFLN
jgi:hypothetical protein